MEYCDLIVRGGEVFTPSGLERIDLLINDGKISAIGSLATNEANEVINASGLTVIPGVIDTHVHFREPGFQHKESIYHGCRAAAKGGVTTIFEMPNTLPPTVSEIELNYKLARSQKGAWCDYAYFIGATQENIRTLRNLELASGCAGIKIFMGSSTGCLLINDEELLAKVLNNGKRRVAIHAEDDCILRERKQIAKICGHPRAHPIWRSSDSALKATQRIIRLSTQSRRLLHMLHISCAEEIEFLAEHKDITTIETTINHLSMVGPECYERLGSLAQINPPVRTKNHQQALWLGIDNCTIDVIGSDHAPHTLEEKQLPYPSSPSGLPGVQTMLPLLLDHMNAGRLTLARLVDLTSTGPNRIYGIVGKGRIAKGWDADLTLVDLNAEREITNKWIESKCGWTPFDGKTVIGWPIFTVLRGNIIMREDELIGSALGKPVRFQSSLENF
ncbi:dihydroorotase, multifunctional complex type domain protein [Candidatus Endolissoclinum faulkneri L2]|uniref:Dihydroorotase, multifunctional complex type domain protein n=1 Tax=Candidatus Endolissoclinum faulkneri L2 TaxID=1193729 RepID=K7YMQ9_9PROT|nr:dihydroorotase [Candidatus Endolissoclinum faulkneri]AFX98802.1 dihydroorotase, multifunctional complex type domain protein [Candidatus Endolissoclinum faulkneri L2]